MDLHPPQKSLEIHPPFLDQLLAHPFANLHGLRVRYDGDYRTWLLGVEAIEEPLEVGVSTSYRRDGVCGVLAGSDVYAVVRVGVASLAYLLWIGHLYYYCVWEFVIMRDVKRERERDEYEKIWDNFCN